MKKLTKTCLSLLCLSLLTLCACQSNDYYKITAISSSSALGSISGGSEEKIIERLSSRRMCTKCAQPTSTDWMVDGKCEKCGGEVYIRDDDKPEVIKNRLQKQAVPQDMIDFYKNKGVFNKIESRDTKEETYSVVKSVLSQVNND